MSTILPGDMRSIVGALRKIATNTDVIAGAFRQDDDGAPMSVRESRGELAAVPSWQPPASIHSDVPMILMPRAVINALAGALGDFSWGDLDAANESDRQICGGDLVDALNDRAVAIRFLDAAERAMGASFGNWRDA